MFANHQLAAASQIIAQHDATERAMRRSHRAARRTQRRFRRTLPGFSSHDTAILEGLGTTIRVPVGTRIATQGAPGREAFVLTRGQLTVARDGTTITKLVPGQLAGEMAVLTRKPRNADVVATTEAELVVLTPPELRASLERIPVLAAQVIARSA